MSHLKPLIWLASYPKSGNTWVRLLLRQLLSDAGAVVGINESRNEIIAGSKELLQRVTGCLASELRMCEVRALRSVLFRRIAEGAQGHILVKTHDCFSGSVMADPDFDASSTHIVIYIVRNPLDVAPSFAHHAGLGVDEIVRIMGSEEAYFRGDAEQFDQPLSSWSHHVMGWVNQRIAPALVIRYEDLLADSAQVVARIVRAIGLAASCEEVRAALAVCDFERLRAAELAHGFVEQSKVGRVFFRRGAADGWRDSLTAEQMRTLVNDHGEVMRLMGYACH